jgi:hypothetical protein
MKSAGCLLLGAAMLAVPLQAEAKNMFYGLAASWCDIGRNKPRFEITDDGSLIYDQSKGRVCQIKNATNMDDPFGDYVVTWRCASRDIKEKLTTFVQHDKNGDRRFLLTRRISGKAETFEQCTGEEAK